MKHYSLKTGIKKARTERNLTQQQFADLLGVHIKTVMNWEQGIATPATQTLVQIADVLQCDIDKLFDNMEDMSRATTFISEKTGLSTQAVEMLQNMNNAEKSETGGLLRDHIHQGLECLDLLIRDNDVLYDIANFLHVDNFAVVDDKDLDVLCSSSAHDGYKLDEHMISRLPVFNTVTGMGQLFTREEISELLREHLKTRIFEGLKNLSKKKRNR